MKTILILAVAMGLVIALGITSAHADITVQQDNTPEEKLFLDMVGKLREIGIYISYTVGQGITYLNNPIVEAYASGIPDWVKTSMGWYSDDRIDDKEFMETLQFLIDEGIINVPQQTIIKEVQAQPLADNHEEIWAQLNFHTDQIENTVKRDVNADIYGILDEHRKKITIVEDRAWDNEKRIEILNTPVDNPSNFEYERKYNELLEMYIDMGQRVVDLEREHLD